MTAGSTEASGPLPELDASSIIGPIFVGNTLDWLLLGTLILQVYTYYFNFPNDTLRLRLLVLVLLCLDIVQTAFGTHMAWFYMVKTWSNPAQIGASVWSEAMNPVMCSIIQTFYAWRIWTLRKSVLTRCLTVVIVLIALSQSLTATISSVLIQINSDTKQVCDSTGCENIKSWIQTVLRLQPEYELWLAGSFVADILISGCMVWILYTEKRDFTVTTRIESIINKLMINAIQTGLVTVACAGVELSLFVTVGKAGNYPLIPAYILGKLYSNSLLVTLNARKALKIDHHYSHNQAESINFRVVTHQTESNERQSRVPEWPGPPEDVAGIQWLAERNLDTSKLSLHPQSR
ncbi:hypothetical protein FA95DRAFT_1604686 [Auriscalpium vulgare]|uniref:Uncharacterized protein n=1 Tax=Auriscalpium vulgare TaxID=40419 RepID=A0ACB8RZV8_9AGAM|nr:hypothetical protein FA95DRAFT_1604686 [Auriscalpium vulgare]